MDDDLVVNGPHVGIERIDNAHADWRAWYDVEFEDDVHVSFTFAAETVPDALEGLAGKIRGERA